MKRTAQNILAKIFVSILIISVFLPILSAFEVITYNDLGNGGWHSLTTDSENGNDFYKADSNWDYHSSDGMHETDDEEGSIYYRFILKDYLIKAGSLKIGVYFWSHAGGLWPWAINGPDLYAYNYKNNEWEMIKQSLGNWDDLDWAWVDCSNDYISSDGKVQFNIFSCYDDSVLIEKVAVKYQMGDEAINSLNITPVDENDDSYPDGFVADVNVDVGLSNDGSKTNVRAIYNLLTPNGDIIDTIQDTWQITSNTVEYHQCSLTALGSINGEYTLNIQLFDSAENKEDDVSVQIDLFPCPPSAGFSVDINGLIVSFNDNTYLCNGYIESWRWEFGDGCTSAEQNPVHKFESEGEFLIALTIIDSFGLSDSAIQQLYDETGDDSISLEYFRKAFAINRKELKALIKIGDVYFKRNQLKLAESYYNAALSVDPKYSNGLLGIAKINYKKDNFFRAIVTLKQVDIEKEYNKAYHYYYAECAYKLQDYKTAYYHYKTLLQFRNDPFFISHSYNLVIHKKNLTRRFVDIEEAE